ncbi:hypothetical protein [Peptoniphilus sp.]|uniref:hypothetical protein n=1 Tax=Peptoniphilus sp. TaxID=1971214 RepID=UPI003995E373
MKSVVEIYEETGDFEQAVRESGLPALEAHMELMESGLVNLKDPIVYRNREAYLGAKAEEMFQEMIPEAVDANRVIQRNNPTFDFMFGELKIDIKFSSMRFYSEKNYRGKVSPHYAISSRQKADLYIAFCESRKGYELINPYVLVIPAAFMFEGKKGYSKSFIKGGTFFNNFVIYKKDLRKVLERYDWILGYEKRLQRESVSK